MRSDAALILGFDCSAAHCAAALVRGGATLASRFEPPAPGQAERLFPMLEALLAEAGASWTALGGLAVCTGPGHFTGLRVGVAAARGLAMALGVPAIGVTRFAALAAGRPGSVLVLLDGGRERVAFQAFRDGAPLAPPALAEVEAVPRPAPHALCLGHRAVEIAGILGLEAGSESVSPDPAVLARLAALRLESGEPPPAPLYLRPPDAAPASEPPPLILDDA